MKYAQIDFETSQMISRPQNLPARWTTPAGATINQFDKLPQAALFGLGWLPVVYGDLPDPQTHQHAASPRYDAEQQRFVYDAIARDLELLRDEACDIIDQAAGAASAKYITVAAGQEARYLLKLEQARLCQQILADGGTPAAEQCPMIIREANATGQTVEQATQTVLDQAAAWLTVAAAIEAARIGGKQTCRTAPDNEAVIAARDNAIAALKAV